MALSLAQMLEALFGIRSYLRTNPEVSSVGVSASRILRGNPQRVSIVVFNLSANNVYIAPFNDVSATNGFYIAPNGGSVTMQWDRDFEMLSHEWWGIAPAGASNIYVMENIIN